MKITYKPALENYLQFQLYKYSGSKRFKRERLSIYLLMTFCVLIFSVIMLLQAYASPVSCLIFGVLVFIYLFYALRFRNIIKRHYVKYLQEFLTPQNSKPVTLEIVKNSLVLKQDGRESKAVIADIGQITEISACYFIELDSMSSYILPKTPASKKFVKILTEKYNVKLEQKLKWKW